MGAGWVVTSVVGSLLPGWLLVFAVVLGASNGGVPVTDAGNYVGGVALAAGLFAAVSGVICGAGVGVLQWLMLRRVEGVSSEQGTGWIGATLLGWGASWAVEGVALALLLTSLAVEMPLRAGLLVLGGIALVGGWAIYGGLTGVVLVRLRCELSSV